VGQHDVGIKYCVNTSGEDLSRYSNNIESVRLRKCPRYHYLTKNDVTYLLTYNNKHFSELAPHHGGKTAGIDML